MKVNKHDDVKFCRKNGMTGWEKVSRKDYIYTECRSCFTKHEYPQNTDFKYIACILHLQAIPAFKQTLMTSKNGSQPIDAVGDRMYETKTKKQISILQVQVHINALF